MYKKGGFYLYLSLQFFSKMDIEKKDLLIYLVCCCVFVYGVYIGVFYQFVLVMFGVVFFVVDDFYVGFLQLSGKFIVFCSCKMEIYR